MYLSFNTSATVLLFFASGLWYLCCKAFCTGVTPRAGVVPSVFSSTSASPEGTVAVVTRSRPLSTADENHPFASEASFFASFLISEAFLANAASASFSFCFVFSYACLAFSEMASLCSALLRAACSRLERGSLPSSLNALRKNLEVAASAVSRTSVQSVRWTQRTAFSTSVFQRSLTASRECARSAAAISEREGGRGGWTGSMRSAMARDWARRTADWCSRLRWCWSVRR